MRGKPLFAGGAILAAVAASACCLAPALLAALGLGSIGTASRFAPYRPVFGIVALVLLGMALRRSYRADDACCWTDTGRKRQHLSLSAPWAVTAVALVLLAYPEIAARTAQAQRPPAPSFTPGFSVTFFIPSMDCAACATGIEGRLRKQPGVVSAAVDFGTKRAVIRYDPRRTTEQDLEKAIDATGFPAKPLKGNP